tara:strand:- start:129451 stop:129972 length:522 start_codon:yes stop_codon:yes gene_type:complete
MRIQHDQRLPLMISTILVAGLGSLSIITLKQSRKSTEIQSEIHSVSEQILQSAFATDTDQAKEKPRIEIQNVLDFSTLVHSYGATNVNLNMSTSRGDDHSDSVFLESVFHISLDQFHALLGALHASDPVVRIHQFRVDTAPLSEDEFNRPFPIRVITMTTEIMPSINQRGQTG